MKVQYLPVILLPLSQVAAWTQSPHFACRVVHTVLRLHEDDQVDMERNRLEHLFFDATADFQEDFIPVVNNMDQMSHLPVHDWMESSHDNMFDDWSDTSPCFGDECDQCEIPDDYKQESIQVNVLKFLGITRAEPIAD